MGSEQTSLAERQRVVDDAEAGALEAWARHRRLADVVGEAVRRADAAARLDVAIRLHDARARAAR